MRPHQDAIWKVGQSIIVRQVGYALIRANTLGDVFMRRKPSARADRMVFDLNQTPVGRLDHCRLFVTNCTYDVVAIGFEVALKGAGITPMLYDLPEGNPGLHHI